MRKVQKKIAGNYIQLLNQAHNGLRKAFELKRYSIAGELLEQCQEMAIKLGELIESADGSKNPSIPLLEDYCELVYQIYKKIKKNNIIDSYKTCKALRRKLVQIENIIKNDKDTRIEVVFLPYKASMWDSLESVWKAAKEDPNCDTYVIPIPYYDKNPDGSFREEHYEGDSYPDYVSIIRYDEFDFELHHPDVIFIHNPYDACNYVTSVHPDFYASRLRHYTEQLVYIPYFVSVGHHVDEQLCILPGILYADHVVVEDEEIRNLYIQFLHKYERENNCKGIFGKTEEKILALGSPKFDKILSAKQENLDIPPDLEKLLYNPEGTRKKVVFYNSTIAPILKEESYIDKIRRVLKIFYDYRNEIVLLWRPHPLAVSTMEAVRPEWADEYKQLLKDYQKAGYGIYDETSDIYRAAALSDAYYGDWSSVVSLYQKTGKPILIQNYAESEQVFDEPARKEGRTFNLDFMENISIIENNTENQNEESIGKLIYSKIIGECNG